MTRRRGKQGAIERDPEPLPQVQSRPAVARRSLPLLRRIAPRLARLSTSPLVPVLVLLLAVLGVMAAARAGVRVAETNLPTPPVSEHISPLADAHPTFETGSSYRVEVAAPGEGRSEPGGRLYVQLWTEGRSRVIAVRALSPAGGPAPGRLSIQVVPHLGWICLGEPPARPGPLVASVRSFPPTPFGFVSVNAAPETSSLRIGVTDTAHPSAVVAVEPLRYRIVVDAPVPLPEALARLLFFPTTGTVVPAAAAVALAALLVGWRLLGRERTWTAVPLLVGASLLLHAALLPPFMGGDEAGHVPAIEVQVLPAPAERELYYPGSISLCAEVLEMDRVLFRSEEPLPVGTPWARAWLRTVLGSSLSDAARLKALAAPMSFTIDTAGRAPAYYRLVAALCSPFAHAAAFDRVSAYRLTGVLIAAGLAALACLLLRAASGGEWGTAALGTVALVPYSVAVVASTSNYSPAIGFGLLGAAGVVGGITGRTPRTRLAALAGGIFAFTLGVPFWSDFALGLAALAGLLPFLAVFAAGDTRTGPGRAALAAASVLTLLSVALALAAGSRFRELIVLLPRASFALEVLDQAHVQAGLPYALSPLVLLLAGLLFIRAASTSTRRRATQVAWGASGLLAAVLAGGALALPYAQLPSGYVQPPQGELVRLFLRSLLSNGFSWDQDLLAWKLWLGVPGSVDAPLSPLVYALSRWALSLAVIAGPVLALPFVRRRPRQAAMLLTVGCAALAVVGISFLIRLERPTFPYGRYFLPFYPLVLLPLLSLLRAPGRTGTLKGLLRIAALFHLWTAVHTLGIRYALGTW